VGSHEIKWAKSVYHPRIVPEQHQPPRRGSLLDLVIAVPEKFEKIGFVFVARANTEQEIAKVRAHVMKLGPEMSIRAKSLPSSGVFSDWSKAEVKRWPTHFVEFWQPSKRLLVYGRRLEARVPELGAIMSVSDWGGLKAAADTKLPSAREIAESDAAFALLVREGEDGVFFGSGGELARRLAELRTHL
jgi:hypothetical protein